MRSYTIEIKGIARQEMLNDNLPRQIVYRKVTTEAG
jgi:hypothetical protein